MVNRQTKLSYVLSLSEMLHLAFAKGFNRSHIALQFDISRKTVSRFCFVTARTVLEMLLKQFTELVDFMEQHGPDFCVATVMWDETGQKLKLDAVRGTLPQQQSSTWQVLVSRVQVAVGWIGGMKMYKEFIMPPLPLASNSSAHVYNGLFRHCLTAPLLNLVRRLCLAAKVRSIFFCFLNAFLLLKRCGPSLFV